MLLFIVYCLFVVVISAVVAYRKSQIALSSECPYLLINPLPPVLFLIHLTAPHSEVTAQQERRSLSSASISASGTTWRNASVPVCHHHHFGHCSRHCCCSPGSETNITFSFVITGRDECRFCCLQTVLGPGNVTCRPFMDSLWPDRSSCFGGFCESVSHMTIMWPGHLLTWIHIYRSCEHHVVLRNVMWSLRASVNRPVRIWFSDCLSSLTIRTSIRLVGHTKAI